MRSFDIFALNLIINELCQVKNHFTILVKHFVVMLVPALKAEGGSKCDLVYDLLFVTVQLGQQISLDLSKENDIDFELLWTHILKRLFATENQIYYLVAHFLSLCKHR